jgi:hypothetical protein
VTHREPVIEVSTVQSGRRGESTTVTKYTTDGKPSTTRIFGGVEAKTTAKWEGETLVVTSSAETQQGQVTTEEHWSLSADGKVTTVITKFKGGFGQSELKLVLLKQ